MTQFHEGQEVEVRHVTQKNDVIWRKAQIVRNDTVRTSPSICWEVQFPDGTRAVFDADHIRAKRSDAYFKRQCWSIP